MFAFWHKDIWNTRGFGPEYEDAELLLFTQHLLTLDKFKPSRSCFRVPMKRYTFKMNDKDYWEEEWMDGGATTMIKFIHDHKYRAFFIQSYSDWDPWYYVSGISAFKEYYHIKIRNFIDDKKTRIHKHIVKNAIIKKLKRFINLKAVMSNYDRCYPSIHIFLYYREKESSQEDIIEYNRVMDELEDKYWKDVSFNYIQYYSKFKRYLAQREKLDGEDETLLWKKIDF